MRAQEVQEPERSTRRPADMGKLAALFERQPDVALVYLFGSRAKGGPRAGSDLDLAVLLQGTPDPRTQIDRQLRLAVEVGQSAGTEVDVVLLNRASPVLAHEVVRTGKVIFERDPETRIEFEVYTRRRYFDLQPMIRFHNHALLHRIQEVGLGIRRRGRPGPLETAR